MGCVWQGIRDRTMAVQFFFFNFPPARRFLIFFFFFDLRLYLSILTECLYLPVYIDILYIMYRSYIYIIYRYTIYTAVVARPEENGSLNGNSQCPGNQFDHLQRTYDNCFRRKCIPQRGRPARHTSSPPQIRCPLKCSRRQRIYLILADNIVLSIL